MAASRTPLAVVALLLALSGASPAAAEATPLHGGLHADGEVQADGPLLAFQFLRQHPDATPTLRLEANRVQATEQAFRWAFGQDTNDFTKTQAPDRQGDHLLATAEATVGPELALTLLPLPGRPAPTLRAFAACADLALTDDAHVAVPDYTNGRASG